MFVRALCVVARSNTCRNSWRALYLTRPLTTGTTPCLRSNRPDIIAKNTPKNRRSKSTPQATAPTQKRPNSTTWAERIFKSRLKMFATSAEVRRRSANVGIYGKLFNELSRTFVQRAQENKIPECNWRMAKDAYNPEEGVISIDKYLLRYFFTFAETRLPQKVAENIQSLRELSDLRYPSEWFPEARQMQRKIILHVGPTNSGKTYNALQRLAGAESGIYCGPLRLLAHEIYNRMNAQGVGCNLITGEEKREVSPDAPLTSSTIEMANLGKPLEVAVIDEIQMIADPLRGWAWTQALLGLKAKEIHLCGEAAVVPLIQNICKILKEKVVVHEYKRLTPVEVMQGSLMNDWSRIRKGDCVVSFARNYIFEIKDKIEQNTGLKCAVVYGGLPPETRALQAQTFNDPNSDVDVLVASDAVGMGLNLNIKRVIFSTIRKFDGEDFRYISIPQLKQIGGRAGRFGTTYASGEITTMAPGDLEYVQQSMDAPITYLQRAGLQPTVDIFELFALQMPNEKFSNLLEKFEDFSSLKGMYFLCNFKDQKIIADTIEHIELNLRDRYQFVNAPVSVRNPRVVDAFKLMTEMYSNMDTCHLIEMASLPKKPPTTAEGLKALEGSHKIIMLYMWLR
ncbi:P-loop containing nucleoside triphosphate hydrolase protein [Phascolomyces articulosus]|uniref:RNA helicase n=1 Tax=Phascolomyces articulosus TaxID=60185 RepID=A0AAD5PAZ5_9FUNG|nr:P-loop containing nucleoside triphosphate hydrolase protein [Phascolomyces articulosus]